MPVALNEQHRAQHGPGRCRPAANGPDHAAVALCPPFQVGDVRQRLLALLETLLSRLRLLGLGLRQPLGLAPDLLRDRRQIPPPSRGNRTAAPSVSSSSIASRSAPNAGRASLDGTPTSARGDGNPEFVACGWWNLRGCDGSTPPAFMARLVPSFMSNVTCAARRQDSRTPHRG